LRKRATGHLYLSSFLAIGREGNVDLLKVADFGTSTRDELG
jgi:hypothetical protein